MFKSYSISVFGGGPGSTIVIQREPGLAIGQKDCAPSCKVIGSPFAIVLLNRLNTTAPVGGILQGGVGVAGVL
jgi:hypothetical protein